VRRRGDGRCSITDPDDSVGAQDEAPHIESPPRRSAPRKATSSQRVLDGLIPRRLARAVLWAAGLMIIGLAVWLAVRVLAAVLVVWVPCVVALLLTALLMPFNLWLRRRGLARGLAAASSVVGLLLILASVGTVVVLVTANQIDTLSAQFGTSLRSAQDQFTSLPVSQRTLNVIQDRLQEALQSASHGLAATALTATETSLRFVAGLLLGVFVLFFLLYDGTRIWYWCRSLFPRRTRRRIGAAGQAAWVTLSGFVQGTTVIATVHAVVIGATLAILGVSLFLPLALLIFIGSFVPVVGALLAGGLAVLVTLGSNGAVAAAIVLLVLLIEHELEAHILQPLVVGRYVRLHPLAIILVIAIGAALGGIVGILVAVPITGVAYNAWGPLNGRTAKVVAEARRPSRLSRLWSALHRAVTTERRRQ
jgi:predicted PurR-regulated permease PerM